MTSLNASRLPLKPRYGFTFTPANTIYPLKGLKHEPLTIDWLWGMFNALPGTKPRLRRTQNAAARVLGVRNKPILPPRKAYLTTVDYYEAYLPLFTARSRFHTVSQSGFMDMVSHACKTILPKNLF